MITIIEIMGRHAGWLTAAASLASITGEAPDLIYLPERNFDMDKFLADVTRIYNENGKVIVAVSEGIHDAEGNLIAETASGTTAARDSFGHAQLGGLAASLSHIVKEKTGAKVRGIELSLMQRCGAHIASQTDIDESFMAGKVAVKSAINGITDKMVALDRVSQNPYRCETKLIDLSAVANYEKKVPDEWINEEGNGILQGFIDYALPLIQGETKLQKENGLPRFAKLKKVKAEA